MAGAAARRARATEFAWGAIQGQIVLPDEVAGAAREAGALAYAQAEAEEFCAESVVWLPDAAWMRLCEPLFPAGALLELGFVRTPGQRSRVYSTHGTDAHEDDEGSVFVLVLANDGLTFKQGRQSHRTAPGQWFVFNDRQTHLVKETARSSSYVFWHVPLSRM
ncbi:hypothetical protein [Variovorax sp. JS1663]|uniref:hypothetical protein n=1 Tax=Variovorax sp. JS1663 TaxID=1851577 RepID=UPI000B343E07|nr:hypothetical protein [Variovorax sp. JS1663]OUM00105.1 hypothetical protein A8M77_23270 [Variovorax sp. JS1663]